MTEARSMFRLAAPLALQQAGQQAMGLVDTAMLGRYSDAAIAGAGVGNNLYFLVTCLGLGIMLGLDSVVPQALGAGRPEAARRAFGAGLRLAIIVGLASTLLVTAAPFVLLLTDVEPDVYAEARAYTIVRALGAVPFLLAVGVRSYLAAHSVTRPLVIAVVLGNIVNVGLDYGLIFGIAPLGIPPLGVIGAGLATLIVQVLMLAVFATGVRAIHASAPGDASRSQPSTRADMAEIVHHGAPIGGQLLAEVGIFGVATVLAAHFGKLSAGAHSIALNISSLTFSFALGIASATSVRVGHAVGAEDLALARKRGLLGLQLGLAVMGCFAAVFVIAPATIASGFTDDAAMVVATVPLMQLAALFQLSDGAQVIAAGALRGLRRNRTTLVGNLFGHYLIGLPIMLGLGFAANMRAPGLWWGLSVGLTATAAYLIASFLRSTSRIPR